MAEITALKRKVTVFRKEKDDACVFTNVLITTYVTIIMEKKECADVRAKRGY